MKYKEYKLYCNENELDKLIDSLNIIGLTDIIINDPRDAENFKEVSSDYQWNYVDPEVVENLKSGAFVYFYLNEDENPKPELIDLMKIYDTKVSIVDDNDWLHKWEEYYVPIKIGEKTVAKPVWKEYEKKEDEIVIDIDPGQAFGTGTSPTTYLCVRLMEKYINPGDTVIDVGCGTGILSVLSAKLGAKSVKALDLDIKAVESTNTNVKLNNTTNVEVYHGDLLKAFDFKADIIVANLTADILLNLFDGIKNHLEGKKTILLSGIIDFKEDEIKEELSKLGFNVFEINRDSCWVSIGAKL